MVSGCDLDESSDDEDGTRSSGSTLGAGGTVVEDRVTVKAYFLVLGDSGLPLEGVRIDWRFLRYAGNLQNVEPFDLVGSHSRLTRSTQEVHDSPDLAGVVTNTVFPVHIASAPRGSELVYSFAREGFNGEYVTYTVPASNSPGTGGTVGFAQTVRMEPSTITVIVDSEPEGDL
jgi:hypothetical protein